MSDPLRIENPTSEDFSYVLRRFASPGAVDEASPIVEVLGQFKLETAEADELLDLFSLATDLEFVEDLARRIEAIANDVEPDAVLLRALVQSAAITYRRCFVNGRSLGQGNLRRLSAEPWLTQLSEVDLETHRSFLELANRHIAHRVNDAETAQVIVLTEGPDRVAVSVAVLNHRGIPEPATLTHRLLSLVHSLRGEIDAAVASSQCAVIDSIVSTPMTDRPT